MSIVMPDDDENVTHAYLKKKHTKIKIYYDRTRQWTRAREFNKLPSYDGK